jgi:hypothetical protein
MKVLVTALHARGDCQCRCSNTTLKEIRKGNKYATMGSIAFSVEKPKDALEKAFFHFNWQSIEHEGEAPEHINLIANFSNTHASMSVGDIVKIEYMEIVMSGEIYRTRYFQCAPQGWNRIRD